MRNRRAALEGLPLYLIILIVVAAIVVAILVGWLSTLQHPAIGNLSISIAGTGSSVVSGAAPPGCTTDVACFTKNNAANNCTFSVNAPAGGDAIVVIVTDKSGTDLNGVTVQITAQEGLDYFYASPSDTAVTGSNGASDGQAVFTTLVGGIAANNGGGGTLLVSASYSNGGVTSTQSGQITIEPPSTLNC